MLEIQKLEVLELRESKITVLHDEDLLDVNGGSVFAVFCAAIGAGYVIGRACAHYVLNNEEEHQDVAYAGGGGGAR